jgi:N-formylglutamate amidohydrolase
MLATFKIFQQRSALSSVGIALSQKGAIESSGTNSLPLMPPSLPTPLAAPVVHPSRGTLPVLLSVPHSGREYPDWLVDMASAGREALTSLEDPLVDRLVWRAMQAGIGAVVARSPRAAIDCNRSEDEIDPAIVAGATRQRLSARTRGGLGVIPSRTQAHGHLWRRAIDPEQLEQRLDQAHRSYHRLLGTEIDALRARFGSVLLLDCHSMPPPALGVPPVVLGDCHGRTAARWVSAEAVAIANAAGFAARLNHPFAGGHVISAHGAPGRGVHALQLEIDRRCYLDAGLAQPGPGFDRIAALIETLAVGLGELLLGRTDAIAAE